MIGQAISHYRVIEELGSGEQGTVYRAQDLRLGREVAIKVLSADLAGDPAALAQFERQARLTSGLSHPRICTVHDAGEHHGRPFIVMALLEGETLREVLHRRPLTMREVIDLGLDVAEALEAAHRGGVVHCDLRPGNVMVSPAGHATVMNFGLTGLWGDRARAGPDSGSSTEPAAGPTAAVSAYQSPEQARGEVLDARTDLFSLGAVLYEMVARARAFPGATPAIVLDGVLNRTPPAPRTVNPAVPADLEAVIARALEKDRDIRYQTAVDLVADLRRVQRHAAGAPEVFARTRPARRPSGRSLAVACAVLAIAAAAAWGLWPRPAPLTERDSIVLADVANSTGEPIFDDTLREALAAQLSQSPFLDIVPADRVRETLRMMTRSPDERLTAELAREVCQRQGVKAVLDGSIARVGRAYVVSVEAVDCRTGDSIARAQSQADGQERVLQALGRVASSLRATLGESLTTIQRYDVPLEQATTPSLEALRAYAHGLARRAAGHDTQAIPFLKRAVELDPGFASALSALSAVYGSLGEDDQRERYARLAHASAARVSERERLYIEYQYHDAVTRDELRALQILDVWKQSYPRDHRPPNAMAVALNRLGQYDRAIDEAKEANRRNPAHPFPYSNLAYAYRGAGRFREARETADKAVARQIETLPTRRLLYQLSLIEGKPDEAARHLAWGQGRSREFDLVGAEAQAEAFRGAIGRARELYLRTSDMAERAGFPQVALAYAAQAAWTEALYGRSREAVVDARAVLARQPTAAPRFRAAAALALAGLPDEGAAAVADVTDPTGANTFLKGVYAPVTAASVAIARQQPRRALDALEDAAPYELGNVAGLMPVFLRGLASLAARDGRAAVRAFETVRAHRGVDPFSPLHALAPLYLGRALALAGDGGGSRAAYDEFLTAWARADEDVPILRAARQERADLDRPAGGSTPR